jgi:transcriptional regulator with XRE-family HTH domain
MSAMDSLQISLLARRIGERRAGKGLRIAAQEIGISPATLSRVENGKVPDLETFGKICRWLGEDPGTYLGLRIPEPAGAPKVRVHFKKGDAIKPDSAQALAEMILAAQQRLLDEDF